jgi:hypothetical protein
VDARGKQHVQHLPAMFLAQVSPLDLMGKGRGQGRGMGRGGGVVGWVQHTVQVRDLQHAVHFWYTWRLSSSLRCFLPFDLVQAEEGMWQGQH